MIGRAITLRFTDVARAINHYHRLARDLRSKRLLPAMSTMRHGKRHEPDRSKLPASLQGVEWSPITRTNDIIDMQVTDGMSLLVAVPICVDGGKPESGWSYELSVVDISCDEDYLSVCVQGEPWGWDLDDADWYVVLRR